MMTGMHDVGTDWNGTTVSYQVTMEDNYQFAWGEEVKSLEQSGVPLMGEASLALPQFKASTGLQPTEPNPYLGTRDA